MCVLGKVLRWQKNTPYKVLLYVDPNECLSCNLHLGRWRILMKEIELSIPDSLSFLYYFTPQNKSELISVLLRDRFHYPVFLDEDGRLLRNNGFLKKAPSHCFLLDRSNKVLLLGNPVNDPKIWTLYKERILCGNSKRLRE